MEDVLPKSYEAEIVEDMMSLIASFSSKVYGRRSADRWFPSSKTCSECGEVQPMMELSIRSWSCDCGATHDRDVNAAINLRNLAASSAVTACGEISSGFGLTVGAKLNSVKQEPGESSAKSA